MVNKYYQKHKERLQKESRERYQNPPKEQQHKLLEYMKNIIKSMKSKYLVTVKILWQSGLFNGLDLEMLGNSDIFLQV